MSGGSKHRSARKSVDNASTAQWQKCGRCGTVVGRGGRCGIVAGRGVEGVELWLGEVEF